MREAFLIDSELSELRLLRSRSITEYLTENEILNDSDKKYQIIKISRRIKKREISVIN